MARCRNYYLKEDKSDDCPTNFMHYGGGEWWCTHGSWSGFIRDGDELTLHFDLYGKSRCVTYAAYEEYEE